MTTTTFQRARKPEEIQARRETLLAAAAELFDAEGPLGAGLNAIAARAGFTKSNVYRYFESREEVLLSLFLAEMGQLVPAFAAAMAATPADDLDALADAVTQQFVARPRFGHLTSNPVQHARDQCLGGHHRDGQAQHGRHGCRDRRRPADPASRGVGRGMPCGR